MTIEGRDDVRLLPADGDALNPSEVTEQSTVLLAACRVPIVPFLDRSQGKQGTAF